jgi:hypothetical protein
MNKSGFTILEMMLVVVFFVLAFFPLLSSLLQGFWGGNEVSNTITAIHLTENKIEQLKDSSFSGVTSEAKASVPNYSGYSRQVIVNINRTDLKDVQVITFWNERGTEISYEAKTQIGQ